MLNSSLKLKWFVVAAVACLAGQIPAVASAAEWGSLKGRIVVDGTPAKLPPLAVGNQDPFCVTAKPENEALVLGKDNALLNAVVYLRVPTGKKVDIHPDYEAKMKEPVVLDNKACAFRPHITLFQVGRPLVIKNSDPTGHNTNIAVFAFNQTVPAMGQIEIKPTAVAALPMPVVCNIHSFMKGQVLSLNHPYAIATGDDGTFEIKNLPAGQNEFQFWHEAGGYLKNLKTKGGATDTKGRAKLTIPAGETLDLGDIKVSASALK
jgi:hypothetical protein